MLCPPTGPPAIKTEEPTVITYGIRVEQLTPQQPPTANYLSGAAAMVGD